MVTVFKTGAANPTSGTMTTSSAPLMWDGAGVAGVSATGEMTCVEGVSCDTFTLTVSGTPLDWTGKRIDIVISWTAVASDYDVYVHKGTNAGPTVDSSTGGLNTFEKVEIEPGDLNAGGTTVFTVHVVYASAVAGDQYHGGATVMTSGLGATPTPPPKSPRLEDQLSRHLL